MSITNEMANDMLLTCFLVYSAPRYVRAPQVINFYRVVESSLTHQKRDPLKKLHKYLNALKVGFAHLDKFLSGREFFRQHPDVKYLALDTYVREMLGYLQDIYAKIPAPALDELERGKRRLVGALAELAGHLGLDEIPSRCGTET